MCVYHGNKIILRISKIFSAHTCTGHGCKFRLIFSSELLFSQLSLFCSGKSVFVVKKTQNPDVNFYLKENIHIGTKTSWLFKNVSHYWGNSCHSVNISFLLLLSFDRMSFICLKVFWKAAFAVTMWGNIKFNFNVFLRELEAFAFMHFQFSFLNILKVLYLILP